MILADESPITELATAMRTSRNRKERKAGALLGQAAGRLAILGLRTVADIRERHPPEGSDPLRRGMEGFLAYEGGLSTPGLRAALGYFLSDRELAADWGHSMTTKVDPESSVEHLAEVLLRETTGASGG